MVKKAVGNKKILIVEDEAFLSEMYQTKFTSLGYQVVTAIDGEQGLAVARREKPDIILLDILMPVMNGYEVLKALRVDEDLKDTLVVIFSNLGQDEEITKGLQLGADDYLVKSNLTPSEMVKKVETILKKVHSDKAQKTKPVRVLLIEDDTDLIALYTKRFADEGFVLTVAQNGAWGVKKAKTEIFDVILMDIAMPALNGLEALQALRDTSGLEKLPIIVFSNSIAEDEINEVRNMGASEVFLKARVTPSNLVNRIREFTTQNNE